MMHKCVVWLGRWSPLVLLLWIGLAVWAFVDGALSFLDLSDNSVNPIKGSRDYIAKIAYEAQFPEKANLETWNFIIECKHCRDIPHMIHSTVPQMFFEDTRNFMQQYLETHHHPDAIHVVENYYSWGNDSLLAALAMNFVSEKNTAMISVVQLDGTLPQEIRYDLANEVLKYVDIFCDAHHGFYCGVTGYDVMQSVTNTDVLHRAEFADLICVPISFLFLGYMIRSWRLLLISFVNLGFSLIIAFGIMRRISLATTPPQSITPQFMQVMCLSMSIDYSLFMFSRFCKEVYRRKRPVSEAVELMLKHSGHVVFMSGLTLIISFCGFFIFNTPFLSQMGLGNAIAISLCVLSALTISPSLILLFPNFFSKVDQDDFVFRNLYILYSRVCWCRRRRAELQEYEPLLDQDSSEDSSLLSNQEKSEMKKSYWYASAKKLVEWPRNILTILFLYALAAPLAYESLKIKNRDEFMIAVTRGLAPVEAFVHLKDSFGTRSFQDFNVLVIAGQPDNAVFDERFFGFVSKVSTSLSHLSYTDSVQSLVFANQTPVSLRQAQFLLDHPNQDSVAALYGYQWNRLVNPQNNSMLITVVPNVDPNLEAIRLFIDSVQEVLDKGRHDFLTYFCGRKVYEVGTAQHVVGRFGIMIAITCAMIFLVLSVLFRSAFVPVRLLLTLGVPLAAVYGLAVLVFQEGILDWIGVRTLQKAGCFYWDIPEVTFSLIIGLALDYDVFLIATIQEFRLGGFSHKASIIRAVHDTGSIITSAGVIMSITFFSLLLQGSIAVVSTGWLLVTSVLIDTFIVRTILVPAVMSFADKLAWWPRKVPMKNLLNEFGEPEEPIDA
jgi:uncharacterized membrane protein YdfJ with MMPL/SSD domain